MDKKIEYNNSDPTKPTFIEVDKIRESESIIEELEDICMNNQYILNLLSELKDSRDEEIKGWETLADVHNAEIKRLRDALEEVGNILYIDIDGIGDLETARKIIQEVLKGGE